MEKKHLIFRENSGNAVKLPRITNASTANYSFFAITFYIDVSPHK